MEKERLLKTLFDDPKREHVNIKFFRGTSESISEEALCAEVNAALFQFENGLLEPVDEVDDHTKQVDVTSLSFPE